MPFVSAGTRLLSVCASLAALAFAGDATCADAPAEPADGYLLVHFVGQSARGEQI